MGGCYKDPCLFSWSFKSHTYKIGPKGGGGVKYVLKEVLTKIVVERYRPDKTGSSNLETDLVFSLISFEVSNTISNTVVTG